MAQSLILTESAYEELKRHLFPGDNLESAAFLLCHYGQGGSGFRLLVKEVVPVQEHIKRTRDFVSWPFADYMTPQRIEQMGKEGLSLVTVHSHPNGYDRFSKIDDRNDKELVASVCSWFDDDRPNGAAFMVPSGKIICRIVSRDGKFSPVHNVSVIGERIRIWKPSKAKRKIPEYGMRVSQTFGKGTYALLQQLNVGVVGCSGTGSIMVELLARNCVGNLTLVDPDVVEEKNLNRILNATKPDAKNKVPKVTVLSKAIKRMGMGVSVKTYCSDTYDKEVIESLVDCDVIFGCVDSAAGRYHLESIATAYLIPYFDVGVNLESDNEGNISCADVAAHYVHPENSSLTSRGVYTSEQVTAESWQRTNKQYYEQQRTAGYLADVGEDQPAVISVNMQAACLAFNDFLARLHGFRIDDDADFGTQQFRMVHGYYMNENPGEHLDPLFAKYLGMGERSFLIQNLKGNNEDDAA